MTSYDFLSFRFVHERKNKYKNFNPKKEDKNFLEKNLKS